MQGFTATMMMMMMVINVIIICCSNLVPTSYPTLFTVMLFTRLISTMPGTIILTIFTLYPGS